MMLIYSAGGIQRDDAVTVYPGEQTIELEKTSLHVYAEAGRYDVQLA